MATSGNELTTIVALVVAVQPPIPVTVTVYTVVPAVVVSGVTLAVVSPELHA